MRLRHKSSLWTLSVSWFLASAAVMADPVDSFRPMGHFLVPDGGVAEIISATPDGNTLVYSNSIKGAFGIVDITDPMMPQLLQEIPVDGEPTSVAVLPSGEAVLVVVNTSYVEEGERPSITPGKLAAYSLPDGMWLGEIEIGSGPDSVAVTEIDGEVVAVVAIENEPVIVDHKRRVLDEDAPGDPGDISKRGRVDVVTLNLERFSRSHVKKVFLPNKVELASQGLLFADDPQPEYVSIHGALAAITLQENNGVAILDLSKLGRPKFVRIFSTGSVDDRSADLAEDERIDFSDTYPADVADEPYAGSRVSDAIAWNAAGTALYTADEGEQNFTGGRGFSAWSPMGDFLWDDGGAIEQVAVTLGHYPEGRSENKGVEMEGLATGVYGEKEFVFVSSERGSFLAVCEISDPTSPQIVQVLPTGIAPECVLPLPQKNLLLTADEGDDGFGTISFFEGIAGEYLPDSNMPTIQSDDVTQGWAALSGLAADLDDAGLLYSIPDDALVSQIFTIEVGGPIARLAKLADVTVEVEGEAVQATYDLEGIAVDTSTVADPEAPGFWLAAEGNAEFGSEDYLPNLLIQVTAAGEVQREIALPESVDSPTEAEDTTGLVRSNGFEGVCVSPDGRYLLAAIQRGFQGEPAVDGVRYTRIAVYDLQDELWSFFLYPLEPTDLDGDWIGLSEVTSLGDGWYAVIERDKQFGSAATLKKVYAFQLDGVDAFEGALAEDSDLTGKVIAKTELVDVLEEFTPFEKVEGLTLAADGSLWAVLDNDGGAHETRFVNLGQVEVEP